MEEILNFISSVYVAVPAGVITALGIIVSAIVKIVRISTSNAALTAKLVLQDQKIKKLEDDNATLVTFTKNLLIHEKSYTEEFNRYTLNRKQINCNNERIAYLGTQVEAMEIHEQEQAKYRAIQVEQNKKAKKVRVKVIKNAIAESIAEK